MPGLDIYSEDSLCEGVNKMSLSSGTTKGDPAHAAHDSIMCRECWHISPSKKHLKQHMHDTGHAGHNPTKPVQTGNDEIDEWNMYVFKARSDKGAVSAMNSLLNKICKDADQTRSKNEREKKKLKENSAGGCVCCHCWKMLPSKKSLAKHLKRSGHSVSKDQVKEDVIRLNEQGGNTFGDKWNRRVVKTRRTMLEKFRGRLADD